MSAVRDLLFNKNQTFNPLAPELNPFAHLLLVPRTAPRQQINMERTHHKKKETT
jgi:hypothetical protein